MQTQVVQKEEFRPRLGAEALVELVNWDGCEAIRKVRIAKSYRDSELDRRLRSRRTKEEARILHLAKIAGVRGPDALFADPQKSEIIMSYIAGCHLKDIISALSGKEKRSIFERLGVFTGLLHGRNIIHGDLTTKNILLIGKKLFLFDYGLSFCSERTEDRAEDLHLLKQALSAS